MRDVSPPVWAETLLRTLLGREDGETVAGDLVEEYRQSVYPSRGRSRAVAALITAVFAAALKTIGTGLMFAMWHDPATRLAIANSGGLGESFELPWLVVVPAVVLAIAGGLLGKTATLFRGGLSNL
jgi:hypothetical protein